jgi:hypothetical protein
MAALFRDQQDKVPLVLDLRDRDVLLLANGVIAGVYEQNRDFYGL